MQGPSVEGPIVRLTCYIATALSWLWLMVAISAGGSFWAPLLGVAIGLVLSLPMYLKEQETEQIREAKRDRQGNAERKGDTSRWEVDDPNSNDPPKPKILES
jgi:hypothetical protein